MPILVAPVVPVPVFAPPPELTTVTWTAATGRITPLDDWVHGYLLQPGARGLDMPTYQVFSDQSPAIDGEARRGTRALPREIMLPIAIYSDDSRAAFLARKRQLLRDLNPQRGPGTLTFTEADGSARTIAAYYSSGNEGSEDLDSAGRRWTMYSCTWLAEDPYFAGAPIGKPYSVAGGGDFYPSGVPWAVSDDQILGSGIVVTNPGDVDAFPVWTLTGPLTEAVITNTTTGEEFTLTTTLGSTDTVVIDCRNRIKTVTLNGTTNLWPDLDDMASLWAFQPDDNIVDLAITGATSATRVSYSLTPLYLST